MFGKNESTSGNVVSLESSASVGGFLLYAEADLHFARESLQKYESCLRQIERGLGGRRLEEIEREDLYRIKARFVREKLSDTWLATSLLILRRYLTYLRDVEGRTALDPGLITLPKRRQREVIYLTGDEVDRLVGAIKLRNLDGSTSHSGLRLRALVEVLLGSGLRISEALALNRVQLEGAGRETKIVGKGGRERTVFFTARSLQWAGAYVALRQDSEPALFADLSGRRRMKRADIWRYFERLRVSAGIEKKLTPHILRHTAATQLLFNGCPIGHIKEILGHARLETTCRYYLGVDHRAAKAAHERFLRYGAQGESVK